MSDPVIADKKPAILELDPGKYFWCACGRSATQPFCDGSHRGTGLSPVAVEITERRRVALCCCKHSGQGPMCDGTHRKL